LKPEEVKNSEDKSLQVICYNCGDPGHYSTSCTKARVCVCLFQERSLG
jgi:hypothetical protein